MTGSLTSLLTEKEISYESLLDTGSIQIAGGDVLEKEIWLERMLPELSRIVESRWSPNHGETCSS